MFWVQISVHKMVQQANATRIIEPGGEGDVRIRYTPTRKRRELLSFDSESGKTLEKLEAERCKNHRPASVIESGMRVDETKQCSRAALELTDE
jgi:hypothetical protein